MVITAEFFGMILLVASAAALGLSLVIDVGRVSAEQARLLMLERQIDKRKVALKDWTTRTGQLRADLVTLEARHTEFTGRRHKALTEMRAIEFNQNELVHEVGDGPTGFWTQLAVTPAFAKTERQDIIFSRQIWDYRNVAHVWAATGDQAGALLAATFPARSGVQPTQVLPLALAPDGTPVSPPAAPVSTANGAAR